MKPREYKIDESDIKRLSEFIGELYHDYTLSTGEGLSTCSCGNKGMYVRDICTHENHEFNNTDDQKLCLLELEKRNKWEEFYTYCFLEYPEVFDTIPIVVFAKYSLWLQLNSERFCKMLSNYLLETEKGRN
jgi:hypothetical protein